VEEPKYGSQMGMNPKSHECCDSICFLIFVYASALKFWVCEFFHLILTYTHTKPVEYHYVILQIKW
jgi:hypothetical protein